MFSRSSRCFCVKRKMLLTSYLPFSQLEKHAERLLNVSHVEIRRLSREFLYCRILTAFFFLLWQCEFAENGLFLTPTVEQKRKTSSSTPGESPVKCGMDWLYLSRMFLCKGSETCQKKEKSWVINGVSLVDRYHLRLGGRTKVRLADKCVPESQGCQPRVMGCGRTWCTDLIGR